MVRREYVRTIADRTFRVKVPLKTVKMRFNEAIMTNPLLFDCLLIYDAFTLVAWSVNT